MKPHTTKPAPLIDFAKMKMQRLQSSDSSRKASIDDRIESLVDSINRCDQYFTTSSCSGRCIIFCKDESSKKKGCQWIFVSHDKIDSDQLMPSLDPLKGDLTIKFEAFILHVQCRSMEDAQIMLRCGTEAGFRNSGISVGNKGKFVTAIRSPLSLEVPCSKAGELLVSQKFVDHLTEEINLRFQENWDRTLRFERALQMCLQPKNIETSFDSPETVREEET